MVIVKTRDRSRVQAVDSIRRKQEPNRGVYIHCVYCVSRIAAIGGRNNNNENRKITNIL